VEDETVTGLIERFSFEVLGDRGGSTLGGSAVLADEDPQVDVTFPIGVTPGDTAIEEDSDDVLDGLRDPSNGFAGGVLELCLGNLHDRIVGDIEPATVDRDESFVTLVGGFDEVVAFQRIYGVGDRGRGVTGVVSELADGVVAVAVVG